MIMEGVIMGLFDSWRRKRKPQAHVVIRKPKTSKSVEGEDTENSMESEQVDTASLIAEYEQLVQRKEKLMVDRSELTEKLTRDEISADDFRKALMKTIQEAATVSEKIRNTASTLTSLGFRGYGTS